MKKNLKALWQEHGMLLIITSCIILLQTVVGVALWEKLPEQIATHFNFNSEPDGWTSKAFTVFGMPLVLLALHWICLLSSRSQIRNYSGKIGRFMLLIVPAVSLLTTVLCYGYALGAPFDIGRVVLSFVGLIFAVTGNYLPKVRRNWYTGIKLPWTLADDENWNKTHRMAAPVWVVCGIALMICGLIGYTKGFAFAIIMVMVFLPTVYSFVLHIRKNRE